MHIDVSAIVQSVISFLVAWLVFKENLKKSDNQEAKDNRDYIQVQNKRLNTENTKLTHDNEKLTQENLELQRHVNAQQLTIEDLKNKLHIK